MNTTTRPLSKKAESEQIKQAAMTALREMLPPGTTVYTILRHVSRSGMMRHISVVGPESNDITWQVARVLGDRIDPKTGGIKVGGCGMDMGFSLVYNLSSVLYRGGFECVGQKDDGSRYCPSNDHSNGDRDYTPHHHASGDYALRQRWL